MHPTKSLIERFARAGANWDEVLTTFLETFRGRYLADLISEELDLLSRNPEHVINSGVNQYTLTPVVLPPLEYSIRIVAPFATRPHIVKWLGMRQIIGFRGRGSVAIRRLLMPEDCRIEQFEPGVMMQAAERLELRDMDYVIAAERGEVLDLDAVREPSVLEILTFKADASTMIWTFDENLKSVYAEQSLPVVSRFRNVFNLAAAMGREIPGDIYRRALGSGNSRLGLVALECLFAKGGLEAFEALHDAIESEDVELQKGAERLFALLTSPGSGIRAT